jgi:hypothetical protein
MICRHDDDRASRRTRRAVGLLGGVSVSILFVWGSVPLAASADTEPKPTNRIDHGNGTRNRNIFSLKSPTHNRGYQHTSTSTAGGRTSVQNALCRHVTECNIRQLVIPRQNARPAGEVRTPPRESASASAPAPAAPFVVPFLYIGPDDVVMTFVSVPGRSG